MDARTSEIKKQEYWRAKLRRGKASLFISILALVLSAWSFFETVLRQPSFAAYTAPEWQYGRGPGTDDEFLIVPLTIANHGARPGTILFVELTLKNAAGEERRFRSAAVLQESGNRLPFAPISLQGRTAAGSAIVFTPPDAEGDVARRAFIGGNGRYQARFTFCTAYAHAFGPLDGLLMSQPADLLAEFTMSNFRLERLLAGESGKIAAAAFDVPPRAEEACASIKKL